jgi:hypothetical protein
MDGVEGEESWKRTAMQWERAAKPIKHHIGERTAPPQACSEHTAPLSLHMQLLGKRTAIKTITDKGQPFGERTAPPRLRSGQLHVKSWRGPPLPATWGQPILQRFGPSVIAP